MKSTIRLCHVTLMCLLVSQVSGLPTDMQSDDWRASTILESTLNEYIRPYTGAVVEKVTNSAVWNVLGKTINGLHGAINLTGGYLHTYYEDHLRTPAQNTAQWIEDRTKPIVERVRERFQKKEQYNITLN